MYFEGFVDFSRGWTRPEASNWSLEQVLALSELAELAGSHRYVEANPLPFESKSAIGHVLYMFLLYKGKGYNCMWQMEAAASL